MATATKKGAKRRKKQQVVTHLGFVLDESGSMGSARDGVVAGFNEFVAAMREEEGELLASLAMFDSAGNAPKVRVKYEGVPLDEVPELSHADYTPRGYTPLNDAIFETIERIGATAGKDDRVILVIMTDGMENASTRTSEEVQKVIQAKESDGWAFIYLGANHDSWAQSGGLGVSAVATKSFTSSVTGTQSAMRAAAQNVNAYRSGGSSMMAQTLASTPDFIPEDYQPDPAELEKQRKDAEEAAKAAQRKAAAARKAEIDNALKAARKVTGSK